MSYSPLTVMMFCILTYTVICSLYVGSTRSVTDLYGAWLQVVDSMITGEKKSVEEDDLMSIAMLRSASSSGHVYQEMREYLKDIVGDPLLPLLDISCQQQKPLEILFKEAIADPPVLAGVKVSLNFVVSQL